MDNEKQLFDYFKKENVCITANPVTVSINNGSEKRLFFASWDPADIYGSALFVIIDGQKYYFSVNDIYKWK